MSKFEVFISHSSKDALPASAIKKHLQKAGIRCWKAPDDINPGESWPQAILRALENCRIMVLVWSTNSTSSNEVSKELTLAMKNNLTVVPFRIENVAACGEWEYHLANTHWMDAYSGKMEQHLEGLAIYLKKILSDLGDSGNQPSPPNFEESEVQGKKGNPAILAGLIAAVVLLGGLGVYVNSKSQLKNQPLTEKIATESATPSPEIEQEAVEEKPKQTEIDSEPMAPKEAILQSEKPTPAETTAEDILEPADYTVSAGDNAYLIARRFGITYSELLKFNGLTDPSQIRLGERLKIPRKSSKND